MRYNFIAFQSNQQVKQAQKKYNKRCFWSQDEHDLLSELLLQFGYSPKIISQYLANRTPQQIISHVQKIKIQTSQALDIQLKYMLQPQTTSILGTQITRDEQKSNAHATLYNKIRQAGYGDGIALYLVGGKSVEDMKDAIKNIFE